MATFVHFRETISALDDAKIPKEKRQKMQTDAQLMVEILNKSIQMLNPKIKQLNQAQAKNIPLPTPKKPELPQVSGKNNKSYVAASEAITIESTESEGRFAQAVRDVTVGEILVVEKAHCSVLLAENAQSHCYECFKRLKFISQLNLMLMAVVSILSLDVFICNFSCLFSAELSQCTNSKRALKQNYFTLFQYQLNQSKFRGWRF